MELKLNIYDKNKVVKTYKTKDFTLKTGTCEDILKLVDIDKLNGSLDDEKVTMEILKIVLKAFPKFKTLMQEIFEDLSDEEYENTAVKDVAGVVVNVVMYTVTELFSVSNSKN